MNTFVGLSEHIKTLRQKHLTASEIPTLLGLTDRFNFNRTDLYHQKVNELEIESNDAMKIGQYFEEPILKMFSDEMGMTLTRRNPFRAHSGGVVSCTIDAFAPAQKHLVEAKAHAFMSGWISDEWGEPGTDEIPERYIVQATVQLGVVRDQTQEAWDVCWVPVLMPRRGLQIYRVAFNEDLWSLCLEEAHKFWEQHIVPGVAPDILPSLTTMSRLHRGQRSAAPEPIDDAWVEMYDEGDTLIKQGEQLKTAAKQGAITQMGEDYDEAVTPSGAKISWREQSRRSLDAKRLEQDHPELVRDYQKESTFRVFRVHRPKQKES